MREQAKINPIEMFLNQRDLYSKFDDSVKLLAFQLNIKRVFQHMMQKEMFFQKVKEKNY